MTIPDQELLPDLAVIPDEERLELEAAQLREQWERIASGVAVAMTSIRESVAIAVARINAMLGPLMPTPWHYKQARTTLRRSGLDVNSKSLFREACRQKWARR